MNKENRARVRAKNGVWIEFALDPVTNKPVLISKTRDESTLELELLFVPKDMFDAARRQAAAILRKRKRAREEKSAASLKKPMQQMQLLYC